MAYDNTTPENPAGYRSTEKEEMKNEEMKTFKELTYQNQNELIINQHRNGVRSNQYLCCRTERWKENDSSGFVGGMIYRVKPEPVVAMTKERDELKAKVAEIIEIYAGMEGFKPETVIEAYQARIIEQMYTVAIKKECL